MQTIGDSTLNGGPKPTPFKTRESFASFVSRRSKVCDKDDFIVEQVRGARVLDLGCIDHSSNVALSLGERWLHHRISKASKSTVGLDLLEDEARFLSARGYDIRGGNAESFDLGATFDVIVAGDLIEHLSNIGSFLSSVRRHMRPDSRFIVTTPNPFNVEQTLRLALANRIAVNDQHTAWFDPMVAWELVTRNGFDIIDFRWVDTRFKIGHQHPKLVQKLVSPPLEAMMWLRPLWRRDYALVLQRSAKD